MKAIPFFARFLQNQGNRVRTGVVAGRTKKYPSDGDEFVTLKYPSDDDEGGIDI